MYYKCCVPDCESSRQDAILHKFPKCKNILQKWLDFINNYGSLLNKTVNHADCSALQVCHKHFEARFVTKKSRLLGIAYPTLFLHSEILNGIPINSPGTSETVHPITEHQYAKKMHNDHNYCLQSEQEPHVKRILEPTDELPSTSAERVIDNYIIQGEPVLYSDVLPSISIEGPCESKDVIQQVLPSSKIPTIKKRNKGKTIRSVLKVEALTPKCRKLYDQYRKARKQLSFTRRSKKALRFSKVHSLEETIVKMNPFAQKLLLMQVKLCTKKEKARRFSLDEKLISLSILKQGPKCYRYLQRIFILPSETTLKKLISKLRIEAGINIQIFEAIKDEVSTWSEQKKYCTIIFDEMALETNLFYTSKDEICGFVDLENRTNQFADHVLVFMIKGIIYKWQQPIAFYFCEGSTAAVILKQILKDIITAVGDTGLIPLALVSDQGTSFQSALKNLKEETRRIHILENKNIDDTITISGFNLSVIYDPCHLIKGLRNNFLTKNISYKSKISTWADIVDVYKTDCQHTESRILHKLNDEHVIPEKIKKMKVKNCVRVFSKTVAGALTYTSAFSHYSDGRPVSKTLKNTADMVSFFDDLFDSVNGTTVLNRKKKGKVLRSSVTTTSIHHKFWQEAQSKLQALKFVHQNGREVTVPSIKNWISTLKSMQKLWQILSEKNVKIMRPRYLNSDAIENFFGQVRSYNFRDNNPTCYNFIATFKSLLITGFIKFHHTSFNCEKEDSNLLLKVKSLFQSPKESEAKILQCETNKSCVDTYTVSQEARRERLTIHSRAYTAGWVVRKILKRSCKNCKKDLIVDKTSDIHKWISHKEYNQMSKKKLTYPAEHIVRYFGMIFDETNIYLEVNGYQKKLSENIIKIIKNKVNFDHISCQIHRNEVIQALLKIVIKICIYNWCTVINKILNGTDVVRLEQRSNLPRMQQKAYDKYKKKIKRKNK